MNQSSASDSRRRLPRPCSDSAARAQAVWAVTRSSWTAARRHVERATGEDGTETARGDRHVDLAPRCRLFACEPGWANGMSAVASAKDIFAARKIGSDQLPPASPQLLPLDEAAEAQRASRVGEQFGKVAPGVVQYTTDVLFRDLWLRPDLAPRDRSLVTVSALIASGQLAQIPYHLNRATDNGLTQAQATEARTHMAIYTGWPNVFSAMPVAKEV